MTARIEFMPIETRALSDVSVHPVRHDHARAELASARGEHLFGFILPLVLRKVRIEREQPCWPSVRGGKATRRGRAFYRGLPVFAVKCVPLAVRKAR